MMKNPATYLLDSICCPSAPSTRRRTGLVCAQRCSNEKRHTQHVDGLRAKSAYEFHDRHCALWLVAWRRLDEDTLASKHRLELRVLKDLFDLDAFRASLEFARIRLALLFQSRKKQINHHG